MNSTNTMNMVWYLLGYKSNGICDICGCDLNEHNRPHGYWKHPEEHDRCKTCFYGARRDAAMKR